MCNVIALTGKNIGEYCKIKSRKGEKCWLHRQKYIDVTLQDDIFVDNTEYETENETESENESENESESESENVVNSLEYRLTKLEKLIESNEYRLTKLEKLISLESKDKIITPGQRKSKVINEEEE